MPQDGVALREDAAAELDDGDRAERVVVEELGPLPLWVFLKRVAHVLVRDAGVLGAPFLLVDSWVPHAESPG